MNIWYLHLRSTAFERTEQVLIHVKALAAAILAFYNISQVCDIVHGTKLDYAKAPSFSPPPPPPSRQGDIDSWL